MAMKRHRQGQDCSQILALISPDNNTPKPGARRHGVRHYNAEVRIIEGTLLARQQASVILALADLCDIVICPHSGWVNMKRESVFGDLLWERFQAWRAGRVNHGEGLLRCSSC
jgi:hypothetical protein